MQLIKPSFQILEQEPGILGIFKQIEKAGRICYKSEDKITTTSALNFVNMLINRGHTAMLEHGTVYLTRNSGASFKDIEKYRENKYSVVIPPSDDDVTLSSKIYITTNYRVLLENGWLSDLKYLSEPTNHEKRISVKFICDRGITHEIIRHRIFSFAEQSTRYCNHSKDKFGNELTYVKPIWVNVPNELLNPKPEDMAECYTPSVFGEKTKTSRANQIFLKLLYEAEHAYMELIKEGWQPQQARTILPHALKTELIMTGFLRDWVGGYRTNLVPTQDEEYIHFDEIEEKETPWGFFRLRGDESAHPQVRELAIPLEEEFLRRGYIDEINY